MIGPSVGGISTGALEDRQNPFRIPMRKLLALVLLLIVAALVRIPGLGSPFRLDDYTVIPAGIRHLDDIHLGLSALLARDQVPPGPGIYLFRPLPWLTYVADLSLCGGVALPWVFHASSLTLHLILVVLLWCFLRSRVSALAAISGAAVFALHPSGDQAVSWVAARGDLLVTLTGFLAFWSALRARVQGGAWRSLLTGFLAAATLGCKSTGFAYLPIVLAPLLLGVDRERRLTPLRLLPALPPLAIVIVVRWWFVGTPTPVYEGGVGISAESLPRMLGAYPALIAHAIVPWNTHPSALSVWEPAGWHWIGRLADLWHVDGRSLAVAPFAGLILLAISCGGSQRTRVVVSSIVTLILLWPASFLFSDVAPAACGRTLYAPMLGVAVTLAFVCDGMLERGRVGRWILLALGTMCVALWIDTLAQRTAVDLAAASSCAARTDRIDAALANGPGDRAVVLVDPVSDLAGLPLVSPVVGNYGGWPFRAAERVVYVQPDVESLVDADVLQIYAGSVRVLQFDERGFRGAQDIPPILDSMPPLRPSSALDSWVPLTPVAPRAVAALRIEAKPGTSVTLDVTFESDRASSLVPAVRLEGDGPVIVAVPSSLEWLLGSSVVAVRLRERDTARLSLMGPPQLLRNIPSVGVDEPKPAARLRFGEVPLVKLRDLPPGSTVRLHFDLAYTGRRVPLTFEVPAEARTERDGVSSMWVERRYRQPADQALDFETLGVRLAEQFERWGLRPVNPSIDVQWYAEARRPSGALTARSPRQRFSLQP